MSIGSTSATTDDPHPNWWRESISAGLCLPWWRYLGRRQIVYCHKMMLVKQVYRTCFIWDLSILIKVLEMSTGLQLSQGTVLIWQVQRYLYWVISILVEMLEMSTYLQLSQQMNPEPQDQSLSECCCAPTTASMVMSACPWICCSISISVVNNYPGPVSWDIPVILQV